MRILLTAVLCLVIFTGAVYANPFAGGNGGGKPAVTAEKPQSNGFYNYLNDRQKELRIKLTGVFREMQENPFSQTFLMFILLSFGYGVFHSMGPGHAKSLVSGYILSTPAGLMRSVLFGTIVAFGHAFTSFFVVAGIYYLLKSSVTAGFDTASGVLSTVSYLLILAIGVYLLYRKFRPQKEHTERGFAVPAAIISLTPCPGAMVLAMFCFSNNAPLAGAFSVFFMALGMAVTISSVALIACFVSSGISAGGRYRVAYSLFEFTGIFLLIGFSSFMLIR